MADNVVVARNTENAPKCPMCSQTVAFSHYNNLSAQLPVDPKTGAIVEGGVKEQAEQCFRNIAAIVASIDHDLNDVVRVTIFVKDIMDIDVLLHHLCARPHHRCRQRSAHGRPGPG